MDIPQKIGRYEILEELGRGAMGTVYRAKDPAMDRVVALKTIISVVLASQQGNEFRERFYREARAAGGLAHPGIVPVFDVGEHEGVPFLVMEFISGRTLADVVKKGERLSPERVCEIGRKIAEALAYAHERGVVHRDIKPANILLTSREAHGIERPKITDFGVAKLAEGQTTLTGQILGTPAYMPPEQFTGAPIDGRADIFSLGVVLYWLATGEQPFPGESVTAVSYKVVHTEPVPPRRLNPSLPIALDSIIMKCLAKSPVDRYQTGEDLARELRELRKPSTSSTLQAASPQATTSGRDPDATLYESSPPVTTSPTAMTQPPAGASTVANKRPNRLVFIVPLLAVAALGGWYVLRDSKTPTVQSVQAPVTAVSSTPPVSKSTQDTVPKEVASPVEPPVLGSPVKKPSAPAESATASGVPKKSAIKPEPKAVEAPPPKPEIASLDFDPRTLDPKQNARLKIDAEHMPAGVEFMVEMNGKLFWHKMGSGANSSDDGWYVPPGVHEFRVTATTGDTEKTSNTVSTEFKAKKRNTLKIELRTQGTSPGAGVPQGLYPDTQIVISLK
jgi:eukaryotic-like serine/threonine-protein kinase